MSSTELAAAAVVGLVVVWLVLMVAARRLVRVVRVVDGDTVVLRSTRLWGAESGGERSCRLRGVDAPDVGFRKRRSRWILRHVLSPWVRVRVYGRDPYGRPVVDVWSWGVVPVAAYMRLRGAAVAWDGRGRSPLKGWGWRRLVFGR